MPIGHNQSLKTIQAEIAEAQEKGHLPADLVCCIQDAAQTHRWLARGHRPHWPAAGGHDPKGPTDAGHPADSWHRRPDSLCAGGGSRGLLRIQIRSAVRPMGRVGPSSRGHRRDDAAVGHLQAWRTSPPRRWFSGSWALASGISSSPEAGRTHESSCRGYPPPPSPGSRPTRTRGSPPCPSPRRPAPVPL